MNGNIIKVSNVRLSYPSLFETAKYKGDDTKKYCATLLIPKTNTEFKEQYDKEASLIKKEYPTHKIGVSIKDGDDSEDPYHHKNWILKASTNRRPIVLDRKMAQVVEEDELFYAGCYVNSAISLWYTPDTKYAKVIYCNLHGVQFVKDGEPFGVAKFEPSSAFDEIGDDVDI